MATPKTDDFTIPRLLTVEEVAEILRVSTKTVRRWARSGELSCLRFREKGRSRVRFDPARLREWLAEREEGVAR